MKAPIRCLGDKSKRGFPAHSKIGWFWLAVSAGVHMAVLLTVPLPTLQPQTESVGEQMQVITFYEVVPVCPEPPRVELTGPVSAAREASWPTPEPPSAPLVAEPVIQRPREAEPPKLESKPEHKPKLEPISAIPETELETMVEPGSNPELESEQGNLQPQEVGTGEQEMEPLQQPSTDELMSELAESTIAEPETAPVPVPVLESVPNTSLPVERTEPLDIVSPPQVLSRQEPIYPVRARKRGWSGEVDLTVTITVQGKAEKIDVIKSSGYPVLDKAAQEAVTTWSFTPATMGEEPVPGKIEVIVKFVLE